jgi:hypothetical protein
MNMGNQGGIARQICAQGIWVAIRARAGSRFGTRRAMEKGRVDAPWNDQAT